MVGQKIEVASGMDDHKIPYNYFHLLQKDGDRSGPKSSETMICYIVLK